MWGDDNKLKIVAPGSEDPDRAFLESMGMTLLVCGVLSFISVELVWQAPREVREVSGPAAAQPQTPEQIAADLSERTRRELMAQEWTPAQARAVLAHGDRVAAEAACEAALVGTKEPDEVAAEAALEALEARAERAPRVCLVRAWFNGELYHEPLNRAVATYWDARVETFEAPSAQVTLMVNTYHESRDRPEDPRFYRWLRHCAMHTARPEWRACMKMVRQLQRRFGQDVLQVLEGFLREFPEPEPDELVAAAGMLEQIARHGQPDLWKVGEEDAPAYDRALQRGAIFYLCRFLQSPDDEVAMAAADALAGATRYAARGSDTYLMRWREACKIAFGGNRPDLEFVDLPILKDNHTPALAIWSGRAEDPPRYDVERAFERGDCEPVEGQPLWRCGVRLWKGEGEDALEDMTTAYIDARYVDWVEWGEDEEGGEAGEAGEAPAGQGSSEPAEGARAPEPKAPQMDEAPEAPEEAEAPGEDASPEQEEEARAQGEGLSEGEGAGE